MEGHTKEMKSVALATLSDSLKPVTIDFTNLQVILI